MCAAQLAHQPAAKLDGENKLMDDLIEQLTQMQRYTAALQEMIAAAQVHAPSQAEGSDPGRTVHVILGEDGLPKSFRVANDWNRRIEPANLGSAVLQACQAAMAERLSAWTNALQEEGWEDKLTALRTGTTGVQEASQATPTSRLPVQQKPPRHLSDVTEDVLKALDNVGGLNQSTESVAAAGSAAEGRLTITLSRSGLTSCNADPRWASNQTAARLMDALSEALSRAKRELANSSEGDAPQETLNNLFSEAMALLNQPDRLVD